MGYKKFTVGGTQFPDNDKKKNDEKTKNDGTFKPLEGENAFESKNELGNCENLVAYKPNGKEKAPENALSPGFQSSPHKYDEYSNINNTVIPSCAQLLPQQKQARNSPLSLGSTSEIEIKSAYPIHKSRHNRQKSKKIIARVICMFSVAAIISAMAIAPIPKPIEKQLELLAQYLTGKGAVSVLYSNNSEKFSEENKDKMTFTGNSNISDTKDTAVQPSDTPPEAPEIDLAAGDFTKIANETQYKISVAALMNEAYPIDNITVFDTVTENEVEVFAGETIHNPPEVLIIHTHGTEGYSDTAANNYRSQNIENNVVSVGKKLTEELTKKGVSVIHCEKMFDAESYIKAYSNSFSAVSEYLAEYPTIKYVIDLHRDAIPAPTGGYAKLSSQINETECAQLMMVVGTDEAGATHPGWKSNLRTVLGIQSAAGEKYPGLMRAVNLRKASFNQQLSPGYFILEAGNCGNNTQEVMNSIPLFAECFCDAAINLNS